MCEEKFRFPNSLVAHRMKHKGDYPFSCSVCGKKFVLHTQLKHHELIHKEEKGFVCEYCGKSFSVHTYLKHHKKRMHFTELGFAEMPPYYQREKSRRKSKKSPVKQSTNEDTNYSAPPTLETDPGVATASEAYRRKKKKVNKRLQLDSLVIREEEEDQHSQQEVETVQAVEVHSLIPGMSVGDEAFIITDAHGATNVEVEFVNVGVLEYVVHTTDGFETQEGLKEDDIGVEEVSIQEVEIHEFETPKMATDPCFELIVGEANE
jgi:DNA-directed RNA polymerase subunit RPC12/RpoP